MTDETEQPPVRYERRERVARITLDRPAERNVLNAASMAELAGLVDRAGADDDVRVVVLAAEGRAFCAGADLKAATTSSAEGSFAGDGPGALVRVLTALTDCPKPVICRVQGHVAGGGNGLVAACDIAVAAEDVRFAFSEVRVGVAPAVISVPVLAKLSPIHAAELLLTGERVSAQRALEAGLLTAVVPGSELESEVERYVELVEQGGPLAVAATKRLLRRVPTLPRDEAYAWSARMSAELFGSDEAREGMTAFLERRPASWTEWR